MLWLPKKQRSILFTAMTMDGTLCSHASHCPPPETAARELRSLNDIMELHKDVARLIVTLNDDFFKVPSAPSLSGTSYSKIVTQAKMDKAVRIRVGS